MKITLAKVWHVTVVTIGGLFAFAGALMIAGMVAAALGLGPYTL